MKEEDLKILLESSDFDKENIDEDIRIKIYQYLLSISNWSKIRKENFTFRIPAKSSEEFGLYYIFHLHQGILEKTTNEVFAIQTGQYRERPFKRGQKRETISDSEQNNLKEDVLELKKIVESLQESVKNITKENNILKDLLYSYASSYGNKRITQLMPIDIYLDTNIPEEIFEVYDAVLKFTNILGFDDMIEFEAIKGSWYKKIIAKSSEKLSSEEVQDRLKEVEYGIEVNTILKQQSEIDKNQSEAFANIITSLKDIPNAAIRIGTLIIVKLTDKDGSVSLQTRTLSIKELHLLNKKPELLQIPKQIFKAFAKEVDDESSPQISDN